MAIAPAHAAANKALTAQTSAKSAELEQQALTGQLAALKQARAAPNLSADQAKKLDSAIDVTQKHLSQVSAKLPGLELDAEKKTTAAKTVLAEAMKKDNAPKTQDRLQQDVLDLNAVTQGELDRRLRGVGAPTASPQGNALGGGEAAIDLNGTKFTRLEGDAGDPKISIRRAFDPLTERGIALTNLQAQQLGVNVGDTVRIRDTKTGKTTTAVYYDNAGDRTKAGEPASANKTHFEVDPALADELGIDYRNKNAKVADKVFNGDDVDGRFVIEKNN